MLACVRACIRSKKQFYCCIYCLKPPRFLVRKWEDTPSPQAGSVKSEISSVSSISIKTPTPPPPPKALKRFRRECHAKSPKTDPKSAKSSPEVSSKAADRVNTQLSKASTVTVTPCVENKTPEPKKVLVWCGVV